MGDSRRTLFRDADIRAARQAGIPVLGERANLRPISLPVILNDGTTLPDGGFLRLRKVSPP